MSHLDRSALPPRRALAGRPDVAPGPEDLAWEAELVTLLSSMEAQRTRLADAIAASQPGPALETMVAMVEKVVAFAHTQSAVLDAGGVDDLGARAEQFLASARKLRDRVQRSAWKFLLQLFGRGSDGSDPQVLFVETVRDLIELLDAYFGRYADGFQSDSAARDWAGTYQVFVADLRGLTEGLQA